MEIRGQFLLPALAVLSLDATEKEEGRGRCRMSRC